MKIEFREVKAGGSRFSFSVPPADLELEADRFKFPEPVEVKLTAVKSGDEIIFQGTVSSLIEAECARCLELFEKRIGSKMQFVVQLLDIARPGDTGDDDFVVLPKNAEDFDITDRVREAVILELPYKPLCKTSCRGLCPMCGQNLNEGDCGCTRDEPDERWDTLRKLFGQ